MAGDVYFYHMTRTPLEATLPVLLSKSLEAGWRVLVRGQDPARMDWLDKKLWLGPEDGFLPHGLAGGAQDADQPILLSCEAGNPHGATALVSVDGAAVDPGEIAGYQRVMILFDGSDGDAVAHARRQWKAVSGAGHKALYWSQESGRWEKKAES
ncbi:MAG TPA: DNA polymerase III subunit chi [Aliiroseovarius sp.]|nr:DNA polymerase III subunit chi [Aliiroseovarius sp.]